jgi:hypothetical protein
MAEDIAAGARVGAGHSRDQRGRGRVRDEAPHQLRRDEARGRRVAREDLDHALAVVTPAAGRDPLTEHDFLAAVVHARPEDEVPVGLRPVDRPAGERAGDLGDVLLCVAAVHAERVQLHQLARVVLVESALASAVRSRRHDEVRPGAEPVVEVEEHRRMVRGGAHEVGELAHRVRADRFALVGRDVPPHVALAREHVEVVEPEIDHELFELALARHGTHDLRGLELGGDPRRALVHRVQRLHFLTRHLAVRDLRPQLGIGARELAERLGDGHPERGQLGQGPVGGGVVDGPRAQLAVDPGGDTHRPDALDIAGPRAVREPTQRVNDLALTADARRRRGRDRPRGRGGRDGWRPLSDWRGDVAVAGFG